MATEPKKTRKGGVRVMKDKVIYLTFKGELDASSLQFHENADKVFEVMDADPSIKRLKVVLPRASKKAPAATPTA
jgi:hypothetical protein